MNWLALGLGIAFLVLAAGFALAVFGMVKAIRTRIIAAKNK